MKWITTAIALSLLLSTAHAAEPCILVAGGVLHLPDGGTQTGDLLVRDGAIAAVGKVSGAEGCARIDAAGLPVTAGLVESAASTGLTEVGLEPRTVDSAPKDAPHVRPDFLAFRAYNPRSTIIPVTRMEGVTSVVLTPRGGLIGGTLAWADLAGSTQAEAIRREGVGVVGGIGGNDGSRARNLADLTALLDESAEFRAREKDWRGGKSHPFRFAPSVLRAMWPVLDRAVPLVLSADRAADIEALLRLTAEKKVDLVLVGGAEAWLLADELAARKVPVIIDGLLNGPESFDRIHARADNAKLLDAAGVEVAIASFSTHNARTLPQVAGNVVRAGLPKAKALAAITTVPAKLFGPKGPVGLAKGARANVVVWTGDPLELLSEPAAVLIGGRNIALESRQTKLRDRYLELPGRPGHLPLP